MCSGKVSQVYDYAVEDVSPLGLKEYKVHVVVTPDDPSQLASMSGYEADLKLQLFRGSDVLTVPSEAVFESGGEYFVFTVRDGKAVKTAVEVGYQSPQKTVILSGLPEGEDASFFLCKELKKGYLDGITGEYATPDGYFAVDKDPEGFERFDALFPKKEKLKLPGQLFEK